MSKICINCRRPLEDSAVFCSECGARQPKREEFGSGGQQGAEQSQMKRNLQNQRETEQREYTAGNVGDKSQREKKVSYRSFWKYLLLSVITCGIYGLVVLYGYVKDINKVCEGDGKESKNYIIVLLLSVITCGIYGLYWWYVQGERLYNIASKYGVSVKEKGSTILLWEILGCTLMPGIGMLTATYIMFDNMNRIGEVYNGEVSENKLTNIGDPHPHLIRNVLIVYGVVLLVLIGTIVSAIRSAFTYDIPDEPYGVEEESADYSDVDLEELIGQEEIVFKDTDFIADELGGYELLNGDVYVECTDDKVYMIMITGDENYTPGFHGVKLGMKLEVAEALLEDIYEGTESDETQKVFLNMESRIAVGLECEEEIVTAIIAMRLTEEEIKEYTMSNEYIFEDSDKRYLSEEEVRSIPEEQLLYARNEIFARHGRQFDTPDLEEYFSKQSWYSGTVPADVFDSNVLNDYERKNIELIKRIEDELNGVIQFIGKTGVYIATNPWADTGRIEVLSVNTDSIVFTLGSLEYTSEIMREEAQIIDSNTAQISFGNFSIIFRWTDSGNMTVTHNGQITGMDSGIIDSVTDNQNYTWAAEFNTGGGTE